MADYRNMAFQVALEFGLDPDLFDRLIEVESEFNPKALSGAGAMGLTQLMPGTAKYRGVTDPWDPMQNLRGGAGYLKEQLDEFGNLELALAAYNAGPGAVRKHGGVPPFEETQDYIRKILKGYSQGPSPARAVTPMQIPQAQMPMPTDMQMMPAAAQTAQAMSPWEDPMFWLSLAGGINPSADNPFAGIAPSMALYSKGRFEQKMDQQELQQQQLQQQRIQQAREIAAQSIADPRKAALMRLGALDIQQELFPKPTSAQSNYEFLIARGTPEDEARRVFGGGTTIQNFPSLPKGYRLVDIDRPELGFEKIPGWPEKPPTEGQRVTASFATRMLDAEKKIEEITKAPQQAGGLAGAWDRMMASGGSFTNWLRTEEGQLYQNAADAWIRAKLRKESGADLPAHELVGEYKTFFPQPGDADSVVKQKRMLRQKAMEDMRTLAGSAASSIPKFPWEDDKSDGKSDDDGLGIRLR